MTYEQLKEEAKKQGYNLTKVRERLIPCTCGCNRRSHYYRYEINRWYTVLECKRCGFAVKGINDSAAIRNWNTAIKEQR